MDPRSLLSISRLAYLTWTGFSQFTLWLALVFGTAANLVAEQNDWPQFRGPTGDGFVGNAQLPLSWSETKNVVWKTAISGKGWSSPVTSHEQVWLTTATEDGTEMFVICLDANDGSIVHKIKLLENASPRFCHPTNSYASPTPVIDGGRVYVHFGSYGTFCLDRKTANVVWKRADFECDHWRGPGSSPIIHDGKLFVAFDGFDVQYIVALDQETGETVWRTDRNIDYASNNGDHKKAYSTAQVIKSGGLTQLISPSAAETISYDPATGKERWRVNHGGMNAATRPLFHSGLVFLTNGDSTGRVKSGLYAVRPGADLAPRRRIAWSYDKAPPKRASPVAVGDLLFLISDDGIAACLDAATGTQHWRKRIGGKFRSSPIATKDRVYFSNLDGETTVIAASDQYSELARNQLDNGFQASPAVLGNGLILRSTSHVYRIDSNE